MLAIGGPGGPGDGGRMSVIRIEQRALRLVERGGDLPAQAPNDEQPGGPTAQKQCAPGELELLLIRWQNVLQQPGHWNGNIWRYLWPLSGWSRWRRLLLCDDLAAGLRGRDPLGGDLAGGFFVDVHGSRPYNLLR